MQISHLYTHVLAITTIISNSFIGRQMFTHRRLSGRSFPTSFKTNTNSVDIFPKIFCKQKYFNHFEHIQSSRMSIITKQALLESENWEWIQPQHNFTFKSKLIWDKSFDAAFYQFPMPLKVNEKRMHFSELSHDHYTFLISSHLIWEYGSNAIASIKSKLKKMKMKKKRHRRDTKEKWCVRVCLCVCVRI